MITMSAGKISILFFTLTLLTNLKAQDFRKVSWGMTKSEVQEVETAKLVGEEDGIIAYKTRIAGMEVLVGYIFFKGKLTRAKYLSQANYMDNSQHYNDYLAINEWLEKKYGSPTSTEAKWDDETNMEMDTTKWGYAVNRGELSLSRSYSSATTQITSSLYSEDLWSVTNEILYRTKNEELLKLEEEVILEDF